MPDSCVPPLYGEGCDASFSAAPTTRACSHYQTITMSHYHTFALAHCHSITISQSLIVTIPHCETVTLAYCQSVTLAYCHVVKLLYFNNVTLAGRNFVSKSLSKRSHWHTVKMSHCHFSGTNMEKISEWESLTKFAHKILFYEDIQLWSKFYYKFTQEKNFLSVLLVFLTQ